MEADIGISVSELNLMVAEAIRKDPRTRSLTVRGEVSGFKHHIPSGHWYFSLKDEQASISCVMFRMNNLKAEIRPRDGDSVIVIGYVDVYPRTGSYQLYVSGIRAGGLGDAYLRLEALKRKLQAEGLFDPARKKQIPMVPRKVAVVTSSSGAAIHDILNVSRQRSPFIPIVLIPATVQGTGAGEEIAAGIRRANGLPDVDVIIVGRGGGSQEDLWCFNDECVVRAVAESRIPVVSGVGHEIDTTLCDYAADVRASTPSNAAEIVFPDRRELSGRLHVLSLNLYRAANSRIQTEALRLAGMRDRLKQLSPVQRTQLLKARGEGMRIRLVHAMDQLIHTRHAETEMARMRLNGAIARRQEDARGAVTRLRERLEAVSPLNVLNRGYAMVYGEENSLVTSAGQAEKQLRMRLRFADGEVDVIRDERQGGQHGGKGNTNL